MPIRFINPRNSVCQDLANCNPAVIRIAFHAKLGCLVDVLLGDGDTLRHAGDSLVRSSIVEYHNAIICRLLDILRLNKALNGGHNYRSHTISLETVLVFCCSKFGKDVLDAVARPNDAGSVIRLFPNV